MEFLRLCYPPERDNDATPRPKLGQGIVIAENYLFKIVIAGDGGVGKTTLLHKYVTGLFLADTSMTIGVQFHIKHVRLGDATCTLQLWDFGGQERFRFMLPNYTRGAKGALLLFDTTRMSSLNVLAELAGICRSFDPSLPILLIGTKVDRVADLSVTSETAREYLDTLSLLDYVEVSAKTGQNVEMAFEMLVKKML